MSPVTWNIGWIVARALEGGADNTADGPLERCLRAVSPETPCGAQHPPGTLAGPGTHSPARRWIAQNQASPHSQIPALTIPSPWPNEGHLPILEPVTKAGTSMCGQAYMGPEPTPRSGVRSTLWPEKGVGRTPPEKGQVVWVGAGSWMLGAGKQPVSALGKPRGRQTLVFQVVLSFSGSKG